MTKEIIDNTKITGTLNATGAVDLDSTLNVDGATTLVGALTVNDAGADVDVRMEGDTNANLFYLDASTDRVGIGTNAPSRDLDVNGDLRVRGNDISDSADTIRVTLGATNAITGNLTVTGTGLLASNITPSDDAGATFGGSGLYNVPSGFTVKNGTLKVVQGSLGSVVQELTSTAATTNPKREFIQNRLATTGNTVTTLHTFTIPASTAQGFEIKVIARRTGGVSGSAEDCAYYTHSTLVKNAAGTAAFVGTTTTVLKESVAGYDCILDVTGATMRVRVTGVTTTNITWDMHAEVVSVSS